VNRRAYEFSKFIKFALSISGIFPATYPLDPGPEVGLHRQDFLTTIIVALVC